jgi:hypothetical protein
MTYFLKEKRELKAALYGTQRRAKAAHQRKQHG